MASCSGSDQEMHKTADEMWQEADSTGDVRESSTLAAMSDDIISQVLYLRQHHFSAGPINRESVKMISA